MAKYKVRSGQNIYDVALSLYGSVEGIFDLLVNNPELNMNTDLHFGMELEYSEDIKVFPEIVDWLNANNILVKNGNHTVNYVDMEKFIFNHFTEKHKDIIESLQSMSTDEKNMFWESLFIPRIIIRQQGQLSVIKFKLKPGRHLIIDWNDHTDVQVLEGDNEQEIEHYYKGNDKHVITLYGDFEFDMLDFSGLNGIYYPLGTVYADNFISPLSDIEKINKLIITQKV